MNEQEDQDRCPLVNRKKIVKLASQRAGLSGREIDGKFGDFGEKTGGLRPLRHSHEIRGQRDNAAKNTTRACRKPCRGLEWLSGKMTFLMGLWSPPPRPLLITQVAPASQGFS